MRRQNRKTNRQGQPADLLQKLRLQATQQASVCSSKKRYPSKTEAEQAAGEIELGAFNLELRAYHCIVCAGWHIAKTG